jgi:hypothetical protein
MPLEIQTEGAAGRQNLEFAFKFLPKRQVFRFRFRNEISYSRPLKVPCLR